MMVDAGPGLNGFAQVSCAARSSTLAMGLSAYGQALIWVMETVDATAIVDATAAAVLGAYVAAT